MNEGINHKNNMKYNSIKLYKKQFHNKKKYEQNQMEYHILHSQPCLESNPLIELGKYIMY